MSHSSKQSGLTIIELLVAMSIAVIIVLSTGMIFSQGIKHTRVIAGEAKLTNQASQLVDILTFHIRPAVSLVSSTPNELLIQNPDLTTSHFELAGSALLLNGTSVLQPAISVNELSFTIIDNRTVQVHYQLSIDAGSHPDFSITPFFATTTIALRN